VDQTIIGILVPFLGTSLGAALVFFLKKEIKPIIQKILLGFASGVMIAASVWSLLLPAIEMAENQNKIAWVPATVGFALGVIVLILINNIADKMESKALKNTEDKVKSTSMLVLAVTLHNIPEGRFQSRQYAG
jgi:ZIP family zinc transporter